MADHNSISEIFHEDTREMMPPNDESREEKMSWRLSIPDWARKYGYITWTAEDDEDAAMFFGNRTSIRLWYRGRPLGEKNIDWKNRRISVGKKVTAKIEPEASALVLTNREEGVHIRSE